MKRVLFALLANEFGECEWKLTAVVLRKLLRAPTNNNKIQSKILRVGNDDDRRKFGRCESRSRLPRHDSRLVLSILQFFSTLAWCKVQ